MTQPQRRQAALTARKKAMAKKIADLKKAQETRKARGGPRSRFARRQGHSGSSFARRGGSGGSKARRGGSTSKPKTGARRSGGGAAGGAGVARKRPAAKSGGQGAAKKGKGGALNPGDAGYGHYAKTNGGCPGCKSRNYGGWEYHLPQHCHRGG